MSVFCKKDELEKEKEQDKIDTGGTVPEEDEEV